MASRGGGERVGVRLKYIAALFFSALCECGVEKEKDNIKQMAGEGFFCLDITAVITNFHPVFLSKGIT